MQNHTIRKKTQDTRQLLEQQLHHVLYVHSTPIVKLWILNQDQVTTSPEFIMILSKSFKMGVTFNIGTTG